MKWILAFVLRFCPQGVLYNRTPKKAKQFRVGGGANAELNASSPFLKKEGMPAYSQSNTHIASRK